MDSKLKRVVFLCLFIFVLCLFGLGIYWLKPSSSNEKSNTHHTSTTPHQITVSTHADVLHTNDTKPTQWISPSQQDTAINCQLQLNSQGQLIVNEQVKNCFEYFISQYGERDISKIKQEFKDYIQQQYDAANSTQILDLWSRYLNYREQLSQISAPQAAPDSLEYLKAIFQTTANLRATVFSPIEIEGLFGQENIYDEYTINRTAILQNKSLNETAKANQLNALLKNLPTDLQQQLEQLNTLENLRQLSADIKARNGSPAEIRQMRLNLVGEAATQRLEQLDKQRVDWKSQVTQYLDQRDEILHSGLSDVAKQQAIQQLKNKQFTTPEQQLRLNTFEQQHDKGGALPFSEL